MNASPRETEMFFSKAQRELERARAKFPNSVHAMAALTEEVGELAQALIDHHYNKAPAHKIWDEALQVAAMAARVAIDGDTTFSHGVHLQSIRND